MQLALFCEVELPYCDRLIDVIETIDAFHQIDGVVIPGWSESPQWVREWLDSSSYHYKKCSRGEFFKSDEIVYYGGSAEAQNLFRGRDFSARVVEPGIGETTFCSTQKKEQLCLGF